MPSFRHLVRLIWSVIVCYGVLSSCLILRGSHHRVLVLLGMQYFFVLPASILYLRLAPKAITTWEGPPLWSIILVGGTVVLAAVLTSAYIGNGVTISDESAYRFQARIFASGRAFAEALPGAEMAPPVPTPVHFEHHVYRASRWFGKYPPGWPALLSLAVRLNATYIINPLLGALIAILVFMIGRTFFDLKTASASVLFLVLSPFFFANTVGTMSHAACAVLVVLSCYFSLMGLSCGKPHFFGYTFISIGLSCLIRPFTGFAVGLAIGGNTLYWAYRKRQRIAPIMAFGAMAATLTAACYLAVQYYYTGSPLISPYTLSAGSDSLREIDIRPLHVIANAFGLQRREFLATTLYTTPFWMVLAAYALWYEPRNRAAVFMMMAPFPVTVFLYLAQPEAAAGVNGGRYYFEPFCLGCIVAARGLMLLLDKNPIARPAASLLLLVFGALQLTQHVVASSALLGLSKPSREVWQRAQGEERVVFLHGVEDNGPFIPKFCNWNDPDWRHARHVFLVDPGSEARQAWAARFGEAEWRVVGFSGDEVTVFAEAGKK